MLRVWGRVEGKQALIIKHVQDLKNYIPFGTFPLQSTLSPLKARKGRLLAMANLPNYVFSLLKWEGFSVTGLKTPFLWVGCSGWERSCPLCWSDAVSYFTNWTWNHLTKGTLQIHVANMPVSSTAQNPGHVFRTEQNRTETLFSALFHWLGLGTRQQLRSASGKQGWT